MKTRVSAHLPARVFFRPRLYSHVMLMILLGVPAFALRVNAVTLTVIRQGTNLSLTWPTNNSSFVLYCRTNLNSGNWMAMGDAPIVNGQFTMNQPATNRSQFYRLAGQALPDTITSRKLAAIQAAYKAPFPDTNADSADPSSEFLGKTAWALAAYYLHSNLATADGFVDALHDTSYLGVQNSVDYLGSDGNPFPWEFSLPLLIRLAMNNDINGNPITNSMSATTRTNLLDMIWCALDDRSKTNDAGPSSNSIWGVIGSENHNAVWRSTFLLGAQVLNGAGYPYGPGNPRNTLHYGGTILDHYNAWLSYWLEYFRQRAREGISLEVCSPTYEKYTVAAYCNVMDFGGAGSDRAVMRMQGYNFLTLYWADAANDFSPGATIRGGAGCRMYQDNHLTDGTAYSLRNWLYLYNWHDAVIAGTGHPEVLTAALSPYEPPGIVLAIATNLTKEPYEYNSHRLGAGIDGTYGDTEFYELSTPSYVRRDTQWTPEFVIGSMTYDSTKTYTADAGENQFCGVIFNSAVTNRLIVQGIGTAKSGTADRFGVTSASNQQTLAAALGKDAADNAGMRVFVSNTPYKNLVTNGNWLLTFTMHGYAAIRIATGGYSWVTTNNDGTVCTDGEYLQLGDEWSPLIIQCGRAADYATNFNNFTNAVLTTTYFNWDSVNKVMTYTNLMGQQFKMWRQSDNLPWVGSGPREQSPTYLYQSPYISASPYGGPGSTVTISHPGFADLVLNFDYAQ